MTRCSTRFALLAGTAWLIGSQSAFAQTAPAVTPAQESATATPDADAAQIGVIIVTATKRAESINRVGMTINAATGDTLTQRGITDTASLTKIMAGFNFTPSQFQQPVYVLRGVGLYDSGLGSALAVTVYQDHVPFSSPVMTELSPIDIERVEVLKGPQGTLFEANSTGGAINYIAAKPTKTFIAGADLTYERFNRINLTGFVSGPISSTVGARIAGRASSGGAYQYSLSRPLERLDDARSFQIRAIIDWEPTDSLRFALASNAFRDKSDTQPLQFDGAIPENPTKASVRLLTQSRAPEDPRAADWAKDNDPLRSNDKLCQLALRGDYDLSSGITLTSLTCYQTFKEDKNADFSGINGSTFTRSEGSASSLRTVGSVKSLFRELRLSGDLGSLRWIVGGNYDYLDVKETRFFTLHEPITQPLPFVSPFDHIAGQTGQTIVDHAAFGNNDYQLTSAFTAHAGLRWTRSIRTANSCTFDWSPTLTGNAQIKALQGFFNMIRRRTGPVVLIGRGQCASLTSASAMPALTPLLNGVDNRLDEKSLSGRFGIDYRSGGGTLLYGNSSSGYKAGVISPSAASATDEFMPLVEERIDALEVGFKAPLANGHARLNAAELCYDYRNKQIRGRYQDPIFGVLDNLQNIPKSRVVGVEAELHVYPIRGLTTIIAGTYIASKVTSSYISLTIPGTGGDFKRSVLPYTPKVQIVADGRYELPAFEGIKAFIGASVVYHSKSNATFTTSAAPAPGYDIRDYTLLDFRAGIADPGGAWRLSAFGQNITTSFI